MVNHQQKGKKKAGFKFRWKLLATLKKVQNYTNSLTQKRYTYKLTEMGKHKMSLQPFYHFGLSLESHRAKSPIHVHIFLPAVMEVTPTAPNRLESKTNMCYHLLSSFLLVNACSHILQLAWPSIEGPFRRAERGQCCIW